MPREIGQRDIDFAGFRAFGSRVPVAANDLVRLQELSFGVANDTALAALSVAGLDTGALRWCANFRRWFYLDKTGAVSTLPAVVGDVIIASDGTSRWIAAPIADALWLARDAWVVDPAAADDRGDHPKTLRELNRRLLGSLYDFQPIIQLAGDIPLSDATVLHNVRSVNGSGFPTMVGTKTQIGGDYTVTSYVPGDNTIGAGVGGRGYILGATGIHDPANMGMLLENASGTKCCWIQSSPSTGHVRITPPNNNTPLLGDPGGVVTFTVGETVRVYQLSRLPVYPWGPLSGFNALAWCRFGFGYSAENFHFGQIGSAAPFISRCKSEGAVMNGGLNGAWNTCMFTDAGGVPTILSDHEAFVNFCGVRGTALPSLRLESRSQLILQPTLGGDDAASAVDAENTRIDVEDSDFGAGGIWSMSAFNCSHPVMVMIGTGTVQQPAGAIYGTGNTSYLLNAPSGTKAKINAAGINLATTAPTIARLAGVDRSIPFVDTSDGTAITS
jgi:hypothetical protein